MPQLEQILAAFEKLAPEALAEKWDNVGLIIGDKSQNVDRVLLTLDITEKVINEAIQRECQLIISHHPPIFKPISRINKETKQGRLIMKAISQNLNLYTAHTNLDIASGGLNDYLAMLLNLSNIDNLKITDEQDYYKLVVFVPESHFEIVKLAVLDTGAGFIGNYSHTSFAARGTGTFKPLAESNPFYGNKGELTEINEIKLETIITEDIREKVITSMLDVHPYEEVAYDLYPLANQGIQYSLGRIGDLLPALNLAEYLKVIKEKLNLSFLKFVGDNTRLIEKVAVCSGSGADLIKKAARMQVDLFITGDINYHQAQLAAELGMALVEAGHYQTEVIVKDFLTAYLKERIADVEFITSKIQTNPWNYI